MTSPSRAPGSALARLRRLAARHPLHTYVVLAYAGAWAWWVPLALTDARTGPGQAWPTHLPGLLAPALAVVAVTALGHGRPGLAGLWHRLSTRRGAPRWYALVVLTAGLLTASPIAAALQHRPLPAAADYLTYSGVGGVPLVLVPVIVLVVNGLGEELGWRGFLADALLRRGGVVRTALTVAPVWALWHLPMFWVVASFRALGPGGVVGWLVGLTCGSLVLTWLYRVTGGSTLVTALWHTAFNFATATVAGAGLPAAIATTGVIVATLLIVVPLPHRRRPAP